MTAAGPVMRMLLPGTKHRLNAALVCGIAALYAVAFCVVYEITGKAAATIVIVPVILAGLLYGARGGIVAGVPSFPANILMYCLAGGMTFGDVDHN